jgi:hypothetical protein
MIARDKARMTTLKEVQLALELYKAQYGEYPMAGCTAAGTNNYAGPTGKGGAFIGCTDYIPDLTPEFISVLPTDPIYSNEGDRGYFYRSDGSSYKFMSYDAVEVNIITNIGQEFSRCPIIAGECSSGVQSTTYAVYSDGAEDW